MNTWFCLPPRRLYTWRSPQDREENIVRNQIDFILINKRYSSSIVKALPYPGADVSSDHTLLVARIRIKLATVYRQKTHPRLDLEKLKNENIRLEVQTELSKNLKSMRRTPNKEEKDI